MRENNPNNGLETLGDFQEIKLYVGNASNGNPVYESLPAKPLPNGDYKLLVSPGLALGVAKGDVIQLSTQTGRYQVISRGMNLCIQVYITPNCRPSVEGLVHAVTQGLGGFMDGRTDREVVFSIPVVRGFPAVEKVMNHFTTQSPDAEWFFGNVYDEDGVTPLNWW